VYDQVLSVSPFRQYILSDENYKVKLRVNKRMCGFLALNISADADGFYTSDYTSSNQWYYVRTDYYTRDIVVNALQGVEPKPTKQ
jgi:phosphatidate phosphatase PAH1